MAMQVSHRYLPLWPKNMSTCKRRGLPGCEPSPGSTPCFGAGEHLGALQFRSRDRGTARATLGKGLAVSAFPLYVPV